MIEQNLSLTHVVRRAARDDGAPPLLLVLHGYGANEHDLFGLAPYLDERFLIVSVRAPLTLMAGSYAWFEIGIAPIGVRVDVAQFARSQEQIIHFIGEALAAYGADPQRVYLLGFSQGAMMSASLTLARPDLVAGAVLMSGAASPEMLPPGFDPSQLAGKPLLVVHGTHDPVLSIGLGRASRELFERLPVDLTYREYPMGHEVSMNSLRDVAAWLSARLDADDKGRK